MTNQSGGSVSGAAGGVLAGTYPSPTFAPPGIPTELGYVQVTASQTVTVAAGQVDLTGVTLTVAVGVRALTVEFYCAQISPAAASSGNRGDVILIDVTNSNTAVESGFVACNSVGVGTGFLLKARLAPAAGNRQYKVQFTAEGNTHTLFASATSPMWLQIREV